MIFDLLLNTRSSACSNVVTLKWHVEFNNHTANSLFYALNKIKKKIQTLKVSVPIIGSNSSNMLSKMPPELWLDQINTDFLFTVLEIVPFIILKLLKMVNNTIRHDCTARLSFLSAQLFKHAIKPLLFPSTTNANQQFMSLNHLYSVVSESILRALTKIERVSTLFNAGTYVLNILFLC